MGARRFRIPNARTQADWEAILRDLWEVEGVLDIRVNPKEGWVLVTFEPPATEEDIRNVLLDLGYMVETA